MARDRSRVIQTQAPRRRGGGGGLRVGRLLAVIAIAVLAVVVVGGVAWGAYAYMTRPATVTITADPNDANITIVGVVDGKPHQWKGTGRLTISPATPDTNYLVTVARTGYSQVAPFNLKPAAGEQIDRSVRLVGMPAELTLDVKPPAAVWTLQPASGGAPTSGAGSTTRKLAPGTYTIPVTAHGSQPYKKVLTLDPGSSTTFTAWLDPSGQLVHKILAE